MATVPLMSATATIFSPARARKRAVAPPMVPSPWTDDARSLVRHPRPVQRGEHRLGDAAAADQLVEADAVHLDGEGVREPLRAEASSSRRG